MFEQEAEELFKKKPLGYEMKPELEIYTDGFNDGYQKANEWQYPSKGKYPKECENVWCYCKGIGIKFCCVGHTIVGGDSKVRWWANNKTEELRVLAWKEIVLPELSKEIYESKYGDDLENCRGWHCKDNLRR